LKETREGVSEGVGPPEIEGVFKPVVISAAHRQFFETAPWVHSAEVSFMPEKPA
jgi:hypothetical protein